MLVTAISAALGLVNYSLALTTNITKQMVGLGLAREGVESVRNMRDTNWLVGDLSLDCGTTNLDPCYKTWLDGPANKDYNLTFTGSGYFVLSTDPSSEIDDPYWDLQFTGSPSAPANKLCLSEDVTFGGFYVPADSLGDCGSGQIESDYYRQILLVPETPIGYTDVDLGPRLKVMVRVWWDDRRCSAGPTFPGVGVCGLELVTYLTNWKNY